MIYALITCEYISQFVYIKGITVKYKKNDTRF